MTMKKIRFVTCLLCVRLVPLGRFGSHYREHHQS
jgi:hypothetical protein